MSERLESGARSITPASSGETYDLPRVCAMFDKPYLARYTRGAGGLFRLAETVKLESAGAVGQTGGQKSVTLAFAEISEDSPQERCPWCGLKGALIICSKCDCWVCRSQVTKRGKDEYFRCRKSCGAEGILSARVEEFGGAKGPRTLGQEKQALPSSERPRRLKS